MRVIKKKIQNLKVFVATSALKLQDKINFKNNYEINCLESYGMTEILIFSQRDIIIKKKIQSNVGLLIKGCKVLNVRNSKELFVKSSYINKYFYNLEKKKYSKNLGINKFNTGDLGYLKNKVLFLTGRAKNLIIKGGLNISPEKLEKLIDFKNISQSVFVGIKIKW